MLLAIARFLDVLGVLASLKTGRDDVEKFARYGSALIRVGDAGREALSDATAKMEELIGEQRNLSPLEEVELDRSIKAKLEAIKSVDLRTDEEKAAATAPDTTEEKKESALETGPIG